MKKYGITILCTDTDASVSYIDCVNKLFDTYEQAEQEMQKAMIDELETLGENYKIDHNMIVTHYGDFDIGSVVSQYEIHEFELETKEQEWFLKNDKLKYEFVKKKIENNEYYEQIRNEYNSTENKDDIIEDVLYCYEDLFDSYYSLYVIMDSIEEYIQVNGGKVKDAVHNDNFAVKDRF